MDPFFFCYDKFSKGIDILFLPTKFESFDELNGNGKLNVNPNDELILPLLFVLPLLRLFYS
jgi:hypothetical protein